MLLTERLIILNILATRTMLFIALNLHYISWSLRQCQRDKHQFWNRRKMTPHKFSTDVKLKHKERSCEVPVTIFETLWAAYVPLPGQQSFINNRQPEVLFSGQSNHRKNLIALKTTQQKLWEWKPNPSLVVPRDATERLNQTNKIFYYYFFKDTKRYKDGWLKYHWFGRA